MSQEQQEELPQVGDVLRCEECGMEVTVTKDCQCVDGSPTFECCGRPMVEV